MNNDLISEGLSLMMLGMGTVFVFLALLIVMMSFMSTAIQKYFPEQPASVEPFVSIVESDSDVPDEKTLAIIKSALEQHRNRS